MTGSTLFTVGRNYGYLTQWLSRSYETLEAMSKYSIIVCAEQAHQFPLLNGFTGRGLCLRNAPDLCPQSTPVTRIAS